ncbi:hypothetical protein K438DRAFT_2057813 [Mycena galopus ATCC 62051]|nr:hypothetical protein K438DRAFT_2057813 [Mycena galopus ATCC 62051]
MLNTVYTQSHYPGAGPGRHVITVLGGCPCDVAGWKTLTNGLLPPLLCAFKPAAKSRRVPKPSAPDEDEDEDEPRKPTAKSRPATVHEKMRALMQKGRESNDKAKCKSSKAGKEAGTKQKRAEREEGDEDGQVGEKRREGAGKKRKRVQGDEGDRGRKKKKHMGESNGASLDSGDEQPRPKPKPLHRSKTTATASSSNEHAPSPNISPHMDRRSPSPTGSTDAASATTKRSGSGRPNMVRGSGKGKGPPGLKVWACLRLIGSNIRSISAAYFAAWGQLPDLPLIGVVNLGAITPLTRTGIWDL